MEISTFHERTNVSRRRVRFIPGVFPRIVSSLKAVLSPHRRHGRQEHAFFVPPPIQPSGGFSSPCTARRRAMIDVVELVGPKNSGKTSSLIELIKLAAVDPRFTIISPGLPKLSKTGRQTTVLQPIMIASPVSLSYQEYFAFFSTASQKNVVIITGGDTPVMWNDSHAIVTKMNIDIAVIAFRGSINKDGTLHAKTATRLKNWEKWLSTSTSKTVTPHLTVKRPRVKPFTNTDLTTAKTLFAELNKLV